MKTPPNVLLAAFGSMGDLIPVLSIGQALREKGHWVRILTSGGHSDLIKRAGLEEVCLTSPQAFRSSLGDVPLLGTRYRGLFLRRHAVAWNAALVRYLAQVDAGHTVIIGPERPTLWGDLCAHLHFGITSVRLVVDPPLLTNGHNADWNFPSRSQLTLKESWEREWRNALRELKLNAGCRHVSRLVSASVRTVPRLAIWPRWLAAGSSMLDRVKPIGFVGSPTLRGEIHWMPPPTGRDRLIFMAGSLGTTRDWDRRFAEISRGISESLGCDGLMLGGDPPNGGEFAPGFAWHRYASLDQVLPTARALIHHGGIGTAAAALQFEVPQLIVPRLFAQSSNAEWMRRLGVATVVDPEDFSVSAVTDLLRDFLVERDGHIGARLLAESIEPARSREAICAFIAEWHGKVSRIGRSLPGSASPFRQKANESYAHAGN